MVAKCNEEFSEIGGLKEAKRKNFGEVRDKDVPI
jgi:hypothetical protein